MKGGVRYGGHCCFEYMLVAVFKVSCFPLLNCFGSFLLDIIFLPSLPSRTVCSLLLHLGPRENISSRYKICFAHASH